jgi:hypothetical protein
MMNGLESTAEVCDAPRLDREPEGEHQRFYADLADGLHAMAQPLTILRSALGLLSVSDETEAARKRYLDLSLTQINRTCSMFVSMQNLVASRLEPVIGGSIDLARLLFRIIEDRTPALKQCGIEIAVKNPGPLALAFGDPYRTEQAISTVLDTVSSLFPQGTGIEARLVQSEDFIELAIGGTPQSPQKIKSAERLNLSLVKASILSQRGRYHLTEVPFCVVLALPVDRQDLHGKESFPEVFQE